MPAVPPVPLAWANLTHDRIRFALFTLGIAFAVVLMGVQMGIQNALIDSNCRLIDHLNADLVMVHPYRASLIYREDVSRRWLTMARGVPGVIGAYPLYLDYQATEFRGPRSPEPNPSSSASAARGSRDNPLQTIRVIGIDPESDVLKLATEGTAAPDLTVLRVPGHALFDRRAKASKVRTSNDPTITLETIYGPIPVQPHDPRWPIPVELNGQSLTLDGGFDFGPDFGTDGTLIVSDRTFIEWIRQRTNPFSPEAMVDLGLLKIAPGEVPEVVAERVRTAIAADPMHPNRSVEVLTKAEFRDRERQFWLTMTPIGFAFRMGMILGFIVGMVISYQILSGDVADHLPEYATLRAIGYSNGFLSRVVLQEALILAAMGFLPGIAITAGVYWVLARVTGLPVDLTPTRTGWLLFSAVMMCGISGLLALRKAQKVDPADVF